MKTLNEVIRAHEICVQNLDCIDCPYCDEPADSPKWGCALCGECPKDTLYYLKENRKLKNLLADMVREKIRGENEKENSPLTWDELKQMEGKPVWVEVLSDEIDLSSRWMLVARETKAHSLPLAYTDNIGHWIFGHEDKLGKTWQAYRKERFNTKYEDIPMEYFENGGI